MFLLHKDSITIQAEFHITGGAYPKLPNEVRQFPEWRDDAPADTHLLCNPGDSEDKQSKGLQRVPNPAHVSPSITLTHSWDFIFSIYFWISLSLINEP